MTLMQFFKFEDLVEEKQFTEKLLSCLSERRKDCVISWCVEGKTLEEIATKWNISGTRARGIIYQALRSMRLYAKNLLENKDEFPRAKTGSK